MYCFVYSNSFLEMTLLKLCLTLNSNKWLISKCSSGPVPSAAKRNYTGLCSYVSTQFLSIYSPFATEPHS